ncbi:MAG TPA: glycosyltransferase family 39 protein [Thermoanaerobaculia bacterium]|nr:glycosyltransferase family 39 protein [Thermoanaerobaculia bacterium]
MTTTDQPSSQLSWRWRALALGGALAVAALQGFAITRQSLTSDEAYHLLAGYQADRYGQNGLNLEHPPLLKMVAALPLLAAPRPPIPVTKVSVALTTLQALFADPAAEARARLGGRSLAAAAFGVPLLLVAFLLGRQLGGAAAGIVLAVTLGLDCFVFPVLAMIYTDTAAALGLGLSLLGAARFLRRPDLSSAALGGLGLGLALASKFTGLLALPPLACALLLAPWRGPAPLEGRRRLLAGAAAIAIAWATVELVYAAANRHYDPAYGREAITLYAENRSTMLVEDRLRPWERPLLALERHDPRAAQWLTGLLATRAQGAIGTYPACNFGTMHSKGRWWYFPVLLLARTPLALLLASGVALVTWLLARRRGGIARRRERLAHQDLAAAREREDGGALLPATPPRPRLALLLAVTAGIYLAVAISSNYNAGLRHLLPVLPILYLPAALWASRRPWRAAALFAALFAESLALAPTWLSASNTWWLGDRDPMRFALSTDNCYYHQNLIALREIADRSSLRPLHVLDPTLGGPALERYLGGGVGLAPESPLPAGWYAVGAAVEVCLPAILRSSAGEMYGFPRYRSIAERWLPAATAVARTGEDRGYVAGTFHLYRLGTALPAADRTSRR